MAAVGASATTGQSIKINPTVNVDDSIATINNDGSYQVKITGQALSRPRPTDNLIHLRRGGSFDPAVKYAVYRLAQFDPTNNG